MKSRAQNLALIRGIERRASEPGLFFSSSDGPVDVEEYLDILKATSLGTSSSSTDRDAAARAVADEGVAENTCRPQSNNAPAHRQSNTPENQQTQQELPWNTFMEPSARPSSAPRVRPTSGRPDLRGLRASAPHWRRSQNTEAEVRPSQVSQEDAFAAFVSQMTLHPEVAPHPEVASNLLLLQQEEETQRPPSGRPVSSLAQQKRPSSGRPGTRPFSANSAALRRQMADSRAGSQNDTCRAQGTAAGGHRGPRRPALSARGPRRSTPRTTNRGFSTGAPALYGGGDGVSLTTRH